MSLEKAIATRRSRREFLSQPLTFEQIGELVWAAQGQDPASRYRTAPSAGATYPLELFVVAGEACFAICLPNIRSKNTQAGTSAPHLPLPPGDKTLLKKRH
jgi:hypothetical protein